MTRLFTCGFEDGSLAALNNVSIADLSTAQKRTGAYSISVNSVAKDSAMTLALPTAPSEIYVRFGTYFVNLSTNVAGTPVVGFVDVNSANLHSLIVQATSGLVSLFNGTTLVTSGSVAVTTGAWRCIELYILVADAGQIVCKVDGVTSFTFTGDTKLGSSTQISSLRFAWNQGLVSGIQKYVDDIAINDTTGSVNNSWIGQGGIYLCPISGAGTVTGMTPSAGSNYACVDEVPASDTDYVSSADVADIDLYTIDTSALPTPIRVDAVKLGYRAKVDAGGANLVPVLRSESTTEEQTDDALAMSTSYTVQSVNYDVDPVDDAPWDATKLAALEVGQRKGL